MKSGFAICNRAICNAGIIKVGWPVAEMLFILKQDPLLRRKPDLAFVSAERWPTDEPAPAEAAGRVVPDLADEIVSPTDLFPDLMSKIEQDFAAGVRLVWVIHPAFRKVHVYQSPKAVAILDQSDTLDGGDEIAGFVMPLIRIFPAPRQAPTPPNP